MGRKRIIYVRESDQVIIQPHGLGAMPIKEEGSEALFLDFIEFDDLFFIRRSRSKLSNLIRLWKKLRRI